MTREEVLQKCTVEGNVVKLPSEQLDRKLYQEVAKALELIGGEWKGNKVQGFVFQTDPTDLLYEIANGEKRNLKKEFQFFATPDSLADELVFEAQIEPNHSILEPSAGQGAIVKAINRVFPNTKVYCYELMPINQTILTKISEVEFIGEDFLNPDGSHIAQQFQFDRIIANPPFSKNQDIDHIREMYNCLKLGGRLVSVSSESWVTGTQKKQIEFKNWLSEIGADILDIEKGTFKESGTMVGGKIIVINKK